MFGLVNGKSSERVPLKSIKNRVSVRGFTAEVTATLEYNNHEENPIEAIFVCPLDEQAAVCGFQATIDGRTIVAEVQGKQEARDTYDDAISSGHSAFLMEESDSSSDIFRISVGNLPPQKSAIVEVRFVTALEVQAEGEVVFVLPSVLNPRYDPSGRSEVGSSAFPVVAEPYTFAFELTVISESEIKEITSPSNPITVQLGSDKRQAQVTLDSEAHKFDKDVVVHIMTSEPFQPHAVVENGLTASKGGASHEGNFLEKPIVMLNFLPHFEASESSRTGEFVFVVDRSCSMAGSKIKSVAETLLLFLKSLPDGCYFNVIGFGSSFTKLFKKSKLYNDETLKLACQSCKSLEADRGGTEILAPLQWVFSQPVIAGYPRQVFLLTDGQIGNTQEVIAEVRRNANTTRCFTFGVGHGASTALVKGVARAGKGTAEFIKEGKRMQKKVIKTLKHALQPFLDDVKVNWELAGDWSVEQAPAVLPPVFLGDPLVVYGVLDGAHVQEGSMQGSAHLSYTADKKLVEHTINFHVSDGNAEGASTLHRLAAKCWITEKQDTEGLDKQGIASIISISKASNVVSKHTAFVAVDTESHEPVTGCLQPRPIYANLHATCSYKKMKIVRGLSVPRSGWAKRRGPTAQAQVPVDDLALKCSLADQQVKKARRKGFGSFWGAWRRSFKKARAKQSSTTLHCDQAAYQVDEEPVMSSEPPARAGAVHASRGPATKPHGKDIVLELIALQKASGSWEFGDQVASVCGLASSALLKSCPPSVPCSSQPGKDVWATALGLALLAGKFRDRQDEWEMIVDKGSKWLKSNLPKGVKYEDIMQAAAKALGVELQVPP